MVLNTAKTFSMEIERLAIEKNITHMDAVLDYCHRLDIEPDTVEPSYFQESKREDRSKRKRIELSSTTGATPQYDI